jgi:hypothetical protein
MGCYTDGYNVIGMLTSLNRLVMAWLRSSSIEAIEKLIHWNVCSHLGCAGKPLLDLQDPNDPVTPRRRPRKGETT